MKKIIFTLMAMLFSTMCYCQNGVWKGEGVTFIFEETTITIVDTISIGDVKRERSRILRRELSTSRITFCDGRNSIVLNGTIYYYSVQTLFGIKKATYKTKYTEFDDERMIFEIWCCQPFDESKSFRLTKDVKASQALNVSKDVKASEALNVSKAKALKHTNPFDESKSFRLTKVKDNVDGVYAF